MKSRKMILMDFLIACGSYQRAFVNDNLTKDELTRLTEIELNQAENDLLVVEKEEQFMKNRALEAQNFT